MNSFKLTALYCTIFVMYGCGSSGDNTVGQIQLISPVVSSNGTTPSKGIFTDSPVAGITYRTASLSGITNATGEFQYYPGETVTFSIGDVILGSAPAQSKLTPIELSSYQNDKNPTTVNISRFLQSLDSDGNLDNGIQITPEISAEMACRSIDFSKNTADFNDSDMQAIFVSLNSKNLFTDGAQRTLVSDLTAQYNLRHSLNPSANPFDGEWWASFSYQYYSYPASDGRLILSGYDPPPDLPLQVQVLGGASITISGSVVTFMPVNGVSVTGTISTSGKISIPDRTINCNNGSGGKQVLASNLILNSDGSLYGEWQIGLPSSAIGYCYPYMIKAVFYPAHIVPGPITLIGITP